MDSHHSRSLLGTSIFPFVGMVFVLNHDEPHTRNTYVTTRCHPEISHVNCLALSFYKDRDTLSPLYLCHTGHITPLHEFGVLLVSNENKTIFSTFEFECPRIAEEVFHSEPQTCLSSVLSMVHPEYFLRKTVLGEAR